MGKAISSSIRVIITGATGMVGEGVLHQSLLNPRVEKVLVINRKPGGVSHPKLTEVIHEDFYNLAPIERSLSGYNACFFCLGVTSIGKKEPEYFRLTYTLTMHVAETLSRLNTGMTFCYISGAGTDSSEKGRQMWARVKGKTENDLRKLPFKKTYAFRPGFIQPIPGLKNTQPYYRYLGWLFPIGKALYRKGFCTLEELGNAMINAVLSGYENPVVEGKDIPALSKRG